MSKFIWPIIQGLDSAGYDVELWVQHNKKYDHLLPQTKIPIRFTDIELSINPITTLIRLVRLMRLLSINRFDLVHAHMMTGATLILISAYLLGVPIRIYHNHGFSYQGYRGPVRWLFWALERFQIALATHILSVSHTSLAAAKEDGLIIRPSWVPGTGSAVGIDPSEYSAEHFTIEAKAKARKLFGIAAETKFVLGYVGRPVRRKGFHQCLDAWRKARLQHSVLLIAGCSQEECKKFMPNIESSVIAIAFIEDMRIFYAACDALTLPSYHEGFSYSLLEGGAAGLPLLGTDIIGNRCAIIPRETGILVDTGDSSKLAESIKALAENRTLGRQMGENARNRALTDFRREDVVANILTIYKQIIDI